MKKRLLRGVLVAAVLLGGLLVSAGLTAPAQAKIAPASTSSHGGGHQTVQPLGGCIGSACGRVYNNDDQAWVDIADNWCDPHPCGNIYAMAPGESSTSYFNDTDAFAPASNTCGLYVQFLWGGQYWQTTVYGWNKIDDLTTVWVLDQVC
jgi:hypothetical protein